MMTNVMETKAADNAPTARELRGLAETAISELLTSGESFDLRRASRRTFEEKCLDEVLWESFVDEWIDVAYEATGERTSPLDYHDLTDWCVCGDSAADHRLDCQRSDCDCRRFKRSRRAARPKLRHVASKYSPIEINRARCIELENARYRQLFGDLTGGV
jgi:hypothetical protein